MNIGSESLYANRQGVDTAGHNIANAQTEGFSRQRVNLTARDPSESRGSIIGNGAYVKNITRAHDKFIEKQLNLATQDVNMNQARHDALASIEQIFSTEMQASVSDELTSFFNSLQNLASNPEEIPIRTSVKEAAQDLASAFNRVDSSLKRAQQDMDQQVQGVTSEINDLIQQIANLNVNILTSEAGRLGNANDLRDQQDQLVRTLSEKIDINYYQNEHGAMVVRGPRQSLLVDGKLAARVINNFNNETGQSNLIVLDNEGKHPQDITGMVERGQMKALIDIRDRVIPGLLNQNNELAYGVANQVNSIHRLGYGIGDYKETLGRDLFSVSHDLSDAAISFRVSDIIAEDVSALSAASTPSAPGDNVIANELLRLRSRPVMGNGTMTFTEHYSNYVSALGLDVARTQSQLEADRVIEGDLMKRRESVSGVSLDEEAVNLLRWQTAFAASSKVITTVDEMIETVLSLKR